MNQKDQKVKLIGAGLNGPLLGLELVKRGFDVEIFERRPDMRRVNMSAGRSINLALSTRGIHALKNAGVWSQMEKIIVPMKGRMMHSVAGELTFQRYGKNDSEVINSISRADLGVALMNAAEAAGVKVSFQQRCTGIDFGNGALLLRDEASATDRQIKANVVIGCDGSASAIREAMLKRPGFTCSQQHLDYGYKELTIPAGPDGKYVLDPNALHIWPRGNYMLIALPNIDGTFACILFLPFVGPDSFEQLADRSAVRAFFQERFADAVPWMPNLHDNFFSNPTGAMVTVKCSPWHVGGSALLMGDAAHAIVPFFGQGINCGFEDCSVLLDLIDRYGSDWERIFGEFGQRKIDTDAIADMAVDNFVEMRDRVGDSRFLFRKKVELALEAKYPGWFVPKYAMVTFHRTPYATALRRGQVQEKVLAELCEGVDEVEHIDWRKADGLIRREITSLEVD